jgi:hypothetical protein
MNRCVAEVDTGTSDWISFLFQVHNTHERMVAWLEAEIAHAKAYNRTARVKRLEAELLRISPV